MTAIADTDRNLVANEITAERRIDGGTVHLACAGFTHYGDTVTDIPCAGDRCAAWATWAPPKGQALVHHVAGRTRVRP